MAKRPRSRTSFAQHSYRPMPMRCRNFLIAALGALLLSACGGEPADTRPGQPVSARRAAFKKILLAFEPIGIALREKQYDADRFIAQAGELSKVKDGPWRHFGPDTNYPPTHAKAAVWSDAPRFAAERDAFLQAVDGLTLAAARRDEVKVASAYAAVHDSCRSCQRAFKE